MNKIYAKASVLGVFLMSFLAFVAAAQVTGDYWSRANQAGRNWHGNGSAAAWERYNAGSWSTVNGAPAPTGGNTITITSGSFVTVNPGGLAIIPDGYQLTIEDNAGVILASNTS